MQVRQGFEVCCTAEDPKPNSILFDADVPDEHLPGHHW